MRPAKASFDSIQRAFDDGKRWIGWGAAKGCPVSFRIHACPQHDVHASSIDELTRWLDKHASERGSCWHDALDKGLEVDQFVWSSSYASHQHAARAMKLLHMPGRRQESLDCAMRAARLGQQIADGFDPWGPFFVECQRFVTHGV